MFLHWTVLILTPPLLSHDWCMLRNIPPPLSFGGHGCLCKRSPEHCSSVHRIAVTRTCDQLDWFSLFIITFINTNSPFTRTPERERVSWLFCLGSHFCYFSCLVLGCLELFSNSHFTILREWNLESASIHMGHLYVHLFLVLCIVHGFKLFVVISFRIDYVWLLVSLCFIVILEMYSRYFDPVSNIIIASQ